MKVLILEDETLAAEKLIKLVVEVDPGLEVLGPLKSIESTVEWFQVNEAPDFMICDIRLEDGLSMEAFKQIEFEGPVIFATAYDQYAIKAFEVNSIDYLLKPVQKEKLEASLKKLKKHFKGEQKSDEHYNELIKLLKSKTSDTKSRYMLKVGTRIVSVPVEKISFFVSQDKMTYIVTTDGKRLPYDQSLDIIEEQLDKVQFFRANRQYIVKFDCIEEIHPYFKGRVKIKLKHEDDDIVVSSERSPIFKDWLDN